jgi:antitoxin component HigA of HigAB toxin-antitoxin module
VSYATVDELAEALRIRVTPENTATLTDCLDAAAEEIDAFLDLLAPLAAPPPAAVVRTNVNRAVDWFKAADAAFGVIGFSDTGALKVPTNGFARHASSIVALKQQWGVG